MHFSNAIFAGGGSRCFWQMGFWEGANAAGLGLNTSVRSAGSTSAGCAIAIAALLDRGPEALALFQGYTERNPRNIHWQNLRPGRPGRLLPHIDMFRSAMGEFLDQADVQVLQQFELRFLMAAYPDRLGGPLSALLGFTVYGLEKNLRPAVHPVWARRVGFRPVVGRVAQCASPQDVVDLVIAASCVPPVLPGGRYNGRAVLDGGLIDNVPVILAEDQPGQTLVLLSRQYKQPLPVRPGCTYVQPSQPIRLDKFDYSNPQGLQEVYDLGFEDGRAFAGAAVAA